MISPSKIKKREFNEISEDIKITIRKSIGIVEYRMPRYYKKIAAFDFDLTLAVPKNGEIDNNAGNWKYKFQRRIIREKLDSLRHRDYLIVLFSNKSGLSEEEKQQFWIKISSFMEDLNIPMIGFFSLQFDHNRKPFPGMWEFLVDWIDRRVDLKYCFYVGDLAGREKEWQKGMEADLGDTDRKFAKNIQIQFFTPEEYFLDAKKAEFKLTGFHPDTLLLYETKQKEFERLKEQELVLVMGPPCSGKTRFAKKLYDQGYILVDIKTENPIKYTDMILSRGGRVVLDIGLIRIDVRERYISLANRRNIFVRCCVLQVGPDVAEHLDRVRMIECELPATPKKHYDEYLSNYQTPTEYEKIDLIEYFPFVFESRSRYTKMFLK